MENNSKNLFPLPLSVYTLCVFFLYSHHGVKNCVDGGGSILIFAGDFLI